MLEQLIHNGVLVPEPPSPRNLTLRVRGELVRLTPAQEEMAMAWAKKHGTPYVEDPVFIQNFMDDFSQALGIEPPLAVEEVDFTPAVNVVLREKAAKEALTKEERKALAAERKAQREALKEQYGYAIVDGERVEIGGYFVVAGGYPSWDGSAPGMAFAAELQDKYRSDEKIPHIMYAHGVVEAMIQVEALRLAMQEVPVDELTSVDVLEHGFYQIKDLDTGGITSSPLTFGPGDVEGMDTVRVQQVQEGKIVEMGTWPLRHLYKHE